MQSIEQHRAQLLPLRYIRARPRLFISVLIGFVIVLLLPSALELVTRILIAWNVATIVYIFSIGTKMARATADQIKRYAALNDEGQYVILLLAVLAAIVCVAAIVLQLGLVKQTTGLMKASHLGLAVCTILTAWTFIHIVFAQHYAHEFYDEWHANKDSEIALRGGLEFIGAHHPPDYFDFAYYAFTIGCSTATSDVNVTSRHMRHITLVHSILSFFFNMALLGLTINIAAGLI
jgi:uncharacterized membrane protein